MPDPTPGTKLEPRPTEPGTLTVRCFDVRSEKRRSVLEAPDTFLPRWAGLVLLHPLTHQELQLEVAREGSLARLWYFEPLGRPVLIQTAAVPEDELWILPEKGAAQRGYHQHMVVHLLP